MRTRLLSFFVFAACISAHAHPSSLLEKLFRRSGNVIEARTLSVTNTGSTSGYISLVVIEKTYKAHDLKTGDTIAVVMPGKFSGGSSEQGPPADVLLFLPAASSHVFASNGKNYRLFRPTDEWLGVHPYSRELELAVTDFANGRRHKKTGTDPV
ncbi:MAG TPA: hypothetical protein VFU15_06005 [Bacteroidia bacterium]|nr:hypothetical protein [Bacteroidia bacterium]